jgi:dihydroflavonol-4-reductase
VVTVNPSYVLGPVLSARDDFSSLTMLRRLLNGQMPAVPRLWVCAVDVRDVAAAHVAALALPPAGSAGEERRYVLDNGHGMWMSDIAAMLRKHFAPRGFAVPRYTAPYLLVALFALWDKDAAAVKNSISVKVTSYNPAKARALLGSLRTYETTLVEMAESMIEAGLASPANATAKVAPKSET